MLYKKIPMSEKNENAYLEVYVAEPSPNFTRRAILVIPGGGYYRLCKNIEGEVVAQAFMAQGFNAFVLNYSVITNNETEVFPAQLIEASRAMKHIRDNAEEYNIDPDEVFAVGFSAGGHLCATLGVMWNLPEIYEAIDMPYGYNKPTGIMPIYPVINDYSTEKSLKRVWRQEDQITEEQFDRVCVDRHVTEEASPLFISCGANDTTAPVTGPLALCMAYAKANLTFELHVYPDSPHGPALGNEITMRGNPVWNDPQVGKWVENAAYWAKNVKKKAKKIRPDK